MIIGCAGIDNGPAETRPQSITCHEHDLARTSFRNVRPPGTRPRAALMRRIAGVHCERWQKERFTYDTTGDWPRRTHKVYEAQYRAPASAKLSIEVRAGAAEHTGGRAGRLSDSDSLHAP